MGIIQTKNGLKNASRQKNELTTIKKQQKCDRKKAFDVKN